MDLTCAFRDAAKIKAMLNNITRLSDATAEKFGRPLQIMEVCGGHTHALFRFGLHQLLPDSIEFIHGPGCPVCVLPVEAIDKAVSLANVPGLMLASFGDPLRVPGSTLSLLEARANGADVRVIYSPFDAIALARENPDKEVVFFAIGFDTTLPAIAHTVQTAAREKITNLRFLCFPIRLIPTLCALLEQNQVQIDGFIGPGHVSMVIGADVYRPVAEHYRKPLVVAGFEPLDFLSALYMLVLQLSEERSQIENAYSRVVRPEGNLAALNAISEVFAPSSGHWRGLGTVENSGASLRAPYARFDALKTFNTQSASPSNDPPAYCNAVLTGQIKPHQCPKFKAGCTPETPLGALMVSSEGACAAYHAYQTPRKNSEVTL